MSKIKWGAIVVDGRGKLGGHVFTKTKSGATMRTKVTPVNPQTPAQASARSRLGGNSQAWAGLSEAQRVGWNALASETSKTNIFGDQYFPSGKNLFTSVNNNLVMVGSASTVDAPTFTELPFITLMNAVVDVSASEISLNVQFTGSADDTVLVIEASKPSSPGKYNFDGSFRQIAVTNGGAPIGPKSLWDSYVAKFGVPLMGKKIAFRAYYVDRFVGNASPRFVETAIAQA